MNFFANEEEINEWKIGAHTHSTQCHCIEKKLRTSSFRVSFKRSEYIYTIQTCEWTQQQQQQQTKPNRIEQKKKVETKRNENLIDGKIAYFAYFMETTTTQQ